MIGYLNSINTYIIIALTAKTARQGNRLDSEIL